MPEQKQTRKNNPPIKVYCLPEERFLIEENARAAGKSLSDFMRAIGQGYRVTGVVDCEQVRELARINGDLGRLGGLLKLWLSDDRRTTQFDTPTLRAVLSKIEDTQDQMGKIMLSIVMPRADKEF